MHGGCVTEKMFFWSGPGLAYSRPTVAICYHPHTIIVCYFISFDCVMAVIAVLDQPIVLGVKMASSDSISQSAIGALIGHTLLNKQL